MKPARVKPSRPWVTTALTLGLFYLVLAVAAHARPWPMPLTLTWWMVAGAAPLLYLVLVQASGSRASVLRRLAAVTFLATVHAALALVTAVAYALLGIPHLTAVRDALWAFAPAPLLQMLTVPFIGAPLRRRLIPRRLGRSGAARYRRPVVPAPARQGVAWPTAPVASAPPGSPEADSPAVDAVVEATSAVAGDRAVGEPVVAPASATTVASSSTRIEGHVTEVPALAATPRVHRPTTTPVADPIPDDPAEAPRREDLRSDERRGPERPARREATRQEAVPVDALAAVRTLEHVRVPFASVADQFPGTIFVLPVDEVGARLQERDILLIPTSLVLPQLTEGLVQIGWDVISPQFPDGVLARSRHDIASKIRTVIVLPLEEIVGQLPPELFADAVQAVDTHHLDEFPLPFQPGTEVDATPMMAAPVSSRATMTTLAVPTPETPRSAPPSRAVRVPEGEPSELPSLAAPTLEASPAAASRLTALSTELSLSEPSMPSVAVSEAISRELHAPAVAGSEVERYELSVPDDLEIEPGYHELPASAVVAHDPEPSESPAPTTGSTPERGANEMLTSAIPLDELTRIETDAFLAAIDLEPNGTLPHPVPALEFDTRVTPEPETTRSTIDAEAPTPAISLAAGDAVAVPTEEVAVEASRDVATPAAHEAVTEETIVRASRVPVTAVEPREVRGLFERFNRLDINAESLDGVTVYRAFSPDVAVDTVRALTRSLLPLLRTGWRGPVEQITVRGARAALVLTALGDLSRTGSVLAAAVLRGPSLALVELLGRRGAAAWPASAARSDGAVGTVGLDLARGITDEALLHLAPGLSAFGAVTPACFDVAGGARVFAFVDPDLAALQVAAFANDLLSVLGGVRDEQGLGPVESATCRRGAEQLVARALPGSPLRVLVAAGAVTRPGRAQGQLERVGTALAGRAATRG